jgi:amino-acid N-acetyltransferase
MQPFFPFDASRAATSRVKGKWLPKPQGQNHAVSLRSHHFTCKTRPSVHAKQGLKAHHNEVASAPTSPAFEGAFAALRTQDYGQFVRFLHLASPYVVGHRSRTFVIMISAEVVINLHRLEPLLLDILLLHGLGVRLVLVIGAKNCIDRALTERGAPTGWQGQYRVTTAEAMQVAMEAAGSLCTEISAALSRAPSIPMVRRHARGDGPLSFAPAVQVVSGNFVTAKRRGIVGGIDFGYMGQVRFVQREAVRQQLDAGNIVLLTNVGVTAGGDLLNCNSYDVATHAAVELQADKLLCIHDSDDVRNLHLPRYLPMVDAENLIAEGVAQEGRGTDASPGLLPSAVPSWGASRNGSARKSFSDEDRYGEAHNGINNGNGNASSPRPSSTSDSSAKMPSSHSANPFVEVLLDLDTWQQIGFPNAVLAAVVALRHGVKRAHIVDAAEEGALLLELYTRDGVPGVCMIAADLYEGIRPAELHDAPGIAHLLALLQLDGHQLPFAPGAAGDRIDGITVMEREGKVLGCVVVEDLGKAADGVRTAELAAFIVEPSYRRNGFGDSLLDYVEQSLRRRGFRRVVLVALQGSYEWFSQRGFENEGEASDCDLLPSPRRATVPTVSQLFCKAIVEVDASLDAPEGKRIGF